MGNDALEILKKVETGALSVEEGSRLLQELENGAQAAAKVVAPVPVVEHTAVNDPQMAAIPQPEDVETPPDIGWWKKGWLIPFWVGTGILVFGALQMGWAYSSQRFFWFYCAWLPMLLGLLVLFLSWWSQNARWIHVRVQDADGSRLAISLPLPTGLASWGLRTFGRYIPNIKDKEELLTSLPGILDALGKEKGPTTVEVNDKDGSRVRVYIL